jgi:hypothetical protein
MTTQVPLSRDQAQTQIESEAKNALPVLPLHFIEVRDYTTFALEFAITEGDIVFHFYVTDEVNASPDPTHYWKEVFPNTLSVCVESYFKATYPRIKAAYTEEKASWWMRAYGFGLVLDPHNFVYKFLDELDAALDGAVNSSR